MASNARAYDLIQKAVGADVVHSRVATAVGDRVDGVLLDVGAGTGLDAGLRGRVRSYLAVDIDPEKLRRLRRLKPDAAAVRADATALPIPGAVVDVVLVQAVAHHLDDRQLEAFLSEAARVLRPGGRLLLSDPLWAPRRVPGRVLWAGDRGSHPRTAAQLKGALEARFRIVRWEVYSVLHSYLLAVAEVQGVTSSAPSRRDL